MGNSAVNDTQMSAALEAYIESMKEMWHTPIHLGIKRLKQELRAVHGDTPYVNKLIAAYKKRAWMEFAAVARHRGTYPTHPHYGTKQEVSGETETTEIKVKNGNKK